MSLHGHTHHSRENLRFLTAYRKDFALLPAVLHAASWQHRRFTGEPLDIGRVTWRPPLTPAAALRLESRQVEALGLTPLVSLTDHDDVESAYAAGSEELPVSMEWTVPVRPTFFHLGIHNLPRPRARAIAEAMFRATACASIGTIREVLAEIAAIPGTLTVLNHPLWDEGEVGGSEHLQALERLLSSCREHIHALELNGLRAWSENRAVTDVASRWNKPAISGGDRHGAEPNAILNLTHAAEFSGFAAEVRDGASHVVLMPHYREPMRLRWLVTAKDIFRTYTAAESDAPAWRRRFFYESAQGVGQPIQALWPAAEPLTLRAFFTALDLAASQRFRPAFRRALAGSAEPAFA